MMSAYRPEILMLIMNANTTLCSARRQGYSFSAHHSAQLQLMNCNLIYYLNNFSAFKTIFKNFLKVIYHSLDMSEESVFYSDSFDLCEKLKRVFAPFPANSRGFHATKWQIQVTNKPAIGPYHSGMKLLGNPMYAAYIS